MVARTGSKHHFARLTEDQVREARQRYADGGISILNLANEYDVGIQPMWLLLKGRTWKHVPMPEGLPLSPEEARRRRQRKPQKT